MGDIREFEERLEDATEVDEKLSVLMEYIDFEMQSNFSNCFVDYFLFIFLCHIQILSWEGYLKYLLLIVHCSERSGKNSNDF